MDRTVVARLLLLSHRFPQARLKSKWAQVEHFLQKEKLILTPSQSAQLQKHWSEGGTLPCSISKRQGRVHTTKRAKKFLCRLLCSLSSCKWTLVLLNHSVQRLQQSRFAMLSVTVLNRVLYNTTLSKTLHVTTNRHIRSLICQTLCLGTKKRGS